MANNEKSLAVRKSFETLGKELIGDGFDMKLKKLVVMFSKDKTEVTFVETGISDENSTEIDYKVVEVVNSQAGKELYQRSKELLARIKSLEKKKKNKKN